MKRSLLVALVAVLALATAPYSASAKPSPPCSGVAYCESHLSPTDGAWRTWTSSYRLPPAVEVSINVFAGDHQLGLSTLSHNGCIAWFTGRGARVRVAICKPGWSRVDVRYRSPAPLLFRLQA